MRNVDVTCPCHRYSNTLRLIDDGSDSILHLDGRIYTSTLLVYLSTPDFSMPHNVNTSHVFDCFHLWFCFQAFDAKVCGGAMR